MRSPPPVRSPKMGRRALQRGSNKSLPPTPPPPPLPTTDPPSSSPPPSVQSEIALVQTEEYVLRGLPPIPSGSHGGSLQALTQQSAGSSQLNITTPVCNKGLDRVLLERNLERLLSEHGSSMGMPIEIQAASPELERLLQARDRSREPLHLADLSLSLDAWQPPSATSQPSTNNSNNTNNNNGAASNNINNHNCNEGLYGHAASMPELAAHQTTPQHSSQTSDTPTSPVRKQKGKGQLSVRFQGDNGEEDEIVDAGEDEACGPRKQRTFPRSRSYSGRSRHHRDLDEEYEERRARLRGPRKTTSESHVPSGSRDSREYRDDADSYCSTCSSSSSSDDYAYELPPRRAYGGVRISYVPNDALACARRQQSAAAAAASGLRSPTKKAGGSNTAEDKDKNCIIS